jgi:hypothetical protein
MNRVCVTNYSMHHESGHNMGLHHDRYVDPIAPASQYHFGYVNTTASCRIRTVMAYNNQCTDSGFSCTRVNYFSTPDFFAPRLLPDRHTAGHRRRCRQFKAAQGNPRCGRSLSLGSKLLFAGA